MINMKNSLYEKLNMNAKNSILKSVFITDKKTFEGYPIVEVEPFDETFLNAIKTPSQYDNTLDRIIKKVWNYMDRKETWLAVYTEYGHIEILLSDYYMNEFILKK